jgi:hypothetical protein
MEATQKSVENVLNNVYVSGFIKVFIILYAVLAAPKLPSWIAKLFHHSLFQVVIFALIAYMATKDIGIAVLIAVAFFVSFHTYTRHLLSKVANKSKTALDMVYRTDGILESNGVHPSDDMTVESGLDKDAASLKSDMEDAKVVDAYKQSMSLKPANEVLPGYSGLEHSGF